MRVRPGWWADRRGTGPPGAGPAGGRGVDRGGRQRPGGGRPVSGDPDVGQPLAARAGRRGSPGAGVEGRRWGALPAQPRPARRVAGAARGRPGRLGWVDQCWTLARIAAVVRERFGVDYTLAGMDLLLHRLGWSVQVPARRAAERDEQQIAAWRKESWPAIKRSRRTWAAGESSRTSPARG